VHAHMDNPDMAPEKILEKGAWPESCDAIKNHLAEIDMHSNERLLVLMVQWLSVGLVIERSLVRLPAGLLSS